MAGVSFMQDHPRTRYIAMYSQQSTLQLGVGVCCQIPVERTKTSPLWEEEWDGGIATTYLARTSRGCQNSCCCRHSFPEAQILLVEPCTYLHGDLVVVIVLRMRTQKSHRRRVYSAPPNSTYAMALYCALRRSRIISGHLKSSERRAGATLYIDAPAHGFACHSSAQWNSYGSIYAGHHRAECQCTGRQSGGLPMQNERSHSL